MLSYFGHLGTVENPLDFFTAENYIICKGATDLNILNDLFSFYNDQICPSSQFYLRQNRNWEAHKYTKTGGVSNALSQPHSYRWGNKSLFSDKIIQILASSGIHQALADITGISNYNLIQSLFFDQKTTRAHQDWIYTDSIPQGGVIGVWIALENIREDGIRFYVYPGTHHFTPQTRIEKDSQALAQDFLQQIDQLLIDKNPEMYAPPLEKGDIVLWTSKIVHGTVAGTNNSWRRRSLAGHFLPDGYKYGSLTQGEIPIQYREKYGLKFRYINNMDIEFAKHNLQDKPLVLIKERFINKYFQLIDNISIK